MTETETGFALYYKIFKSSFAYFGVILTDKYIFEILDALSKNEGARFLSLIENIDATFEQKKQAVEMATDCIIDKNIKEDLNNDKI